MAQFLLLPRLLTIIFILNSYLFPQEKVLEAQEEILIEKYIDPLEGKKFGLAFNPISLFLSIIEKDFLLSCGISLYPEHQNSEIAFPIYYNKESGGNSVLHLDVHYRYFIGKHQKGLYISSGMRFTAKKSVHGPNANNMGLTFGMGYRLFSENGFYWGTSLFGGRYLTKSESSLSREGIIDFEILKIGKTF